MNGNGGTRPLTALTGATGFLGGHIADALLAGGRRVRASVRATSDQRWIRDKGIETVEAVLAPSPGTPEDTGTDGIDALVAGADIVIHCAGVVRAPNAEGYRRGNVVTTRRLLEAAARAGTVRAFVLISSLAAAGPTDGRPRVETDPCEPITDYGRSKLEAETLLTGDWPFRTAALRPPALYGPRDVAFLPLFKAARHGLCARIGKVRELSLVDGRDAARAAVLLAEDDRAHGAYFIDDGHVYGFGDMARTLESTFDRRIRILHLPVGLLRFAAAVAGRGRAERLPLLAADRLRDVSVEGWVCDGERLRAELGFDGARDLERGFAETLEFYRTEGWL